jgi:syntaxin 12/13
MSYASADTPRMPDERYNKLVQETSKGIASFNQVTRAIAQKMSLFGTQQDSRSNHQQLKELSEKGNKLVAKINRRLQELKKACVGAHARSRKTQVGKLSSDFKNQLKTFEQTCQKLMESEKNSVDLIRRSSTSFKHEQKMDFNNYNEDQLYAQANITTYDEEGKLIWNDLFNI